MPIFSSRCFKPVLLAFFVMGSILGFAQSQTAPVKPGATPNKPAAASGTGTDNAAPAFTTPKEKLSYAIGLDVGKRLKSTSLEVDPATVERGLNDALTGNKALMTDEELRATMTELQNQLRQKQMAMTKEIAEKNKKEGEAFLAENKTKEGVVTLPSGLQYKILKAGQGPRPTASDAVVCNYRGTLINGKEFDSSYKRNEPATFPVTGVIKGWTEALQLMPVGSKWELFIPPDLAYGERGAGPDIEPDSTLVFEVELLSIQPKEKGNEKK